MSVEFVLYVVGLVGVSYYMGHQHGLRTSIEHVVDQMVMMKLLSKEKNKDEDKE